MTSSTLPYVVLHTKDVLELVNLSKDIESLEISQFYTIKPDFRLLEANKKLTAICIVYKSSLEIINHPFVDSKEIKLDVDRVSLVKFSENGEMLLTFKPFLKNQEKAPNINVYSKNGSGYDLLMQLELPQPTINPEQLAFFNEDTQIILKRTESVEVYSIKDKKLMKKLELEGLCCLSVSKSNICTFVNNKNNDFSYLSLYDKNLNKLSNKTLSRMDDFQFCWNSKGNKVVCLGSNNVDSNNKSYYGQSRAYYLDDSAKFDCLIPAKTPIHNIAWSPANTEFVICGGYMPCDINIFNSQIKEVKKFDKIPKNFTCYSKDAKHMALCGFGSLNGNIDVYKRKEYLKISQIKTRATSVLEFVSNDVFITATLNRNLKVDNEINIYTIYGKLVKKIKYDVLHRVIVKSSRIDLLNDSHKITVESSSTQETEKPLSKYIPPRLRNNNVPGNTQKKDTQDNIEKSKELKKLEEKFNTAISLKKKASEGQKISKDQKDLANSSNEIALKIANLKADLK